jgi:hypothetical protein
MRVPSKSKTIADLPFKSKVIEFIFIPSLEKVSDGQGLPLPPCYTKHVCFEQSIGGPMRIFSSFDKFIPPTDLQSARRGQRSRSSSDGLQKSHSRSRRPQKMNLSDDQIRKKMEMLKNQKNQTYDANTVPQKKAAVKTDQKVEEEVKEIMGDVKKNDPKDPATAQKLKEVLGTGSFGFNEKEKEVLGKILKG